MRAQLFRQRHHQTVDSAKRSPKQWATIMRLASAGWTRGRASKFATEHVMKAKWLPKQLRVAAVTVTAKKAKAAKKAVAKKKAGSADGESKSSTPDALCAATCSQREAS